MFGGLHYAIIMSCVMKFGWGGGGLNNQAQNGQTQKPSANQQGLSTAHRTDKPSIGKTQSGWVG